MKNKKESVLLREFVDDLVYLNEDEDLNDISKIRQEFSRVLSNNSSEEKVFEYPDVLELDSVGLDNVTADKMYLPFIDVDKKILTNLDGDKIYRAMKHVGIRYLFIVQTNNGYHLVSPEKLNFVRWYNFTLELSKEGVEDIVHFVISVSRSKSILRVSPHFKFVTYMSGACELNSSEFVSTSHSVFWSTLYGINFDEYYDSYQFDKINFLPVELYHRTAFSGDMEMEV